MYIRAMVPLFFVAVPLYVPAVAFLVYGYEKYSLAAIGAFLIPVVALCSGSSTFTRSSGKRLDA